MALSRLYPAGYSFPRLDGQEPASNGQVFFYDNETTNLATVYTDVAGLVASANPLTLGDDGRFPNDVFTDETLRVRLVNSLSAQIFQKDHVSPVALQVVALVDDIAAVRALDTSVGDVAITRYHTTEAGRGGATYDYVATSTDADDGGLTLAPNVGSGRWKLRHRGTVSIREFGAIGDGVADDTAALNNAFQASGLEVFFPSGTYSVDMTTATTFATADSVTIGGANRNDCIIAPKLGTATTRTLFDPGNHVRFRSIGIDVDTASVGATLVCFQWGANNLSFDDVAINGEVTGDIASSHLFHAIKCDSSGTFGGLRVHDSTVFDITRVFLRENTDTSIINNIRITNSNFDRSESSMFALNAPNGEIKQVVFDACNFTDPFISAVQTDSYFIGPHANNLTITGCNFRGTGQEAIHIEEAASDITITGNTIIMDVLRGIYCSDNNVGGGATTPQNVNISGNTIRRADEDGLTGVGIELINDGGNPPLAESIISTNIVKGFGTGIKSGGESHDMNRITNNEVFGCDKGVETIYGHTGVANNDIADCTTGLSTITGGGMFGYHRFHNVTTLANATGGELTLLGFEVVYDRVTFTNAPTTTDFDLVPMGANERGAGRLYIHTWHSDTNEDKHAEEFTWDGTGPFSGTTLYEIAGGGTSINVIDNSGNLTVRVTNTSGGDLTNARLEVVFEGAWVFS